VSVYITEVLDDDMGAPIARALVGGLVGGESLSSKPKKPKQNKKLGEEVPKKKLKKIGEDGPKKVIVKKSSKNFMSAIKQKGKAKQKPWK